MWWKFKVTVFYLLIAFLAVFFSFFGTLTWLLPRKMSYWLITRWSVCFIHLAKWLCGVKYQVLGEENIPAKPCVVACNHQSVWETLFMQLLFPQQSWALKRELLFIPFFGWALAALKPIAINRKNQRSINQLLQQGVKRLEDGSWVIIYPEGTRILPNENKRYSRSCAALAIAARCSVLPIAHNAGILWPKHNLKSSGTITVSIGPALQSEHQDASTLTKRIEKWINVEKNRISASIYSN